MESAFGTVDLLVNHCKRIHITISDEERYLTVLLSYYSVVLKDILESDSNKRSKYDLIIINRINQLIRSGKNTNTFQQILNIYRDRKV